MRTVISLYLQFFLLYSFAPNGNSVKNAFPEDFLLGFATSSYQIEGGWNENGKGKSFLDEVAHSHPALFNNDTGDIACDSYHKYKEDVTMLKNLGAQVYRFSLSWSRILPMGDTSVINKAGIDYYNNLIDELLLNDIQPMVTLFHFDPPLALKNIGYFTSPEMVEHFVNYAKIAFENFGDRVKLWITFNEPAGFCLVTCGTEPNSYENHNGEFLCTHYILLSHARAYQLYNNMYRSSQQGLVGISLNTNWYEPHSDNEDDKQAAETRLQFEIGWYAHPIFFGDYPPVMRNRVDALSKDEGRAVSRLPVFDSETRQLVKGSTDFLGLNHYTTDLVIATPGGSNNVTTMWEKDTESTVTQDKAWPSSKAHWLKVVPWGFSKLLNWIKNNYGNPSVFITENGYGDTGELLDTQRINYHKEYIREMLKAIHHDGCKVLGYIVWSLMDNFEWFDGYSTKFGVYHVDFDSPNRTRTPKASAKFFKKLYSTRELAEEAKALDVKSLCQ